jgi:sn-glycerol 3-phosphate transport system substrate-binding protein
MRKVAAFAVALSMVAVACGGGGPSGDQSALAPGKDVKPAATITWWHAMSGINGEALNKVVTNFNNSQSAIKVTTVFQGSYDDLLSKLNTALASNAAPALVQVYDIGQRYMYDSGQVVPMQAFIDRDKFDTSDFEPAVLNYYKYQDKLQSMPWNASSSIFGWFFEQLLATSGSLYADNGNGRDDRATKLVFNNAAGKAILDWWKAGIDGGYFYNPGIDNAGATTAFQAGKTAMYLESSAALRGNINTAKFQVGTGLFARPDSRPKDGGNIIGGASLYIMKSRPADEQQAAWEFVKYAMTPAVQAQWQSDTGYYAIRKSAYNEGPAKDWATKYPQFQTPVDQIRNSPQNRFTNGAVLGIMPQSRARTQKMIESVLLGQATQAALDAAVTEMNDAIDKYNKANK